MHEGSVSAKDRILQRFLLRIRPAFVASWLKRQLNVERQVLRTRCGRFFVDPVSAFAALLLRDGEYEPEMRHTLEHFLRPAATFVDVGANEGYFSVVAAALVGSSGKVIAVEPQSRLKAVLEANFALNDVHGVQLFRCAISDRNGSAALHLSPDTNPGSTALHQSTAYQLPTETVRTLTLTELFELAQVEKADLVKMDIEGFEYEAIMGSSALFRERRIGAIALELHPHAITKRGLDPTAIARLLESCGYELWGSPNVVWALGAE